jgi:hypothetical protein
MPSQMLLAGAHAGASPGCIVISSPVHERNGQVLAGRYPQPIQSVAPGSLRDAASTPCRHRLVRGRPVVDTVQPERGFDRGVWHFCLRASASLPHGNLVQVNHLSRSVAAIEWIHGVRFLTLFTLHRASPNATWSRYCDTRRRKGETTGNGTST